MEPDVAEAFIRVEALSAAESRRVDGLFAASEKAVTAALAAAEKAVAAALDASEKAVAKAEAAQLRVNETQNEFRGTLKDQASMLMPRTETEGLMREMRNQIDLLGTRSDKIDGAAANQHQTFAYVLAGIGFIIGIVGILSRLL